LALKKEELLWLIYYLKNTLKIKHP
jgi:hypothetical protein